MTPIQEERFTFLAGLLLSGEATPDEQSELEQLLRDHPGLSPRLETLRRIWRSRQNSAVNKQEAYSRHLQRLNAQLAELAVPSSNTEGAVVEMATPDPEELENPRPLRRLLNWVAATAAAASITGLLLIWHHHAEVPGNAPSANTVTTRPGSRSRLQLPDGTQVWLNADSKLTYNENFSSSPFREVQLSGEAFFDVAKDASHPFLIHTSVIDVKVLGTSFNVRSYGDDRLTETALIKGSVEVTVRNSPDKKIILKPNEKLVVHNDQVAVLSGHPVNDPAPDEPLMTLSKVHFQKKDSAVTEILWTKNQLAFDNAPLDEVARRLERWYGVKVTIRKERLKNIRLNAAFDDERLPQVMEALGIAGDFKYTLGEKEVIIGP